MEIGIYSFAEISATPGPGVAATPAERLRDLVAEIELADQVGLDVFGVGEHHRPDYVVSAPAVVLAAAVSRTSRIRLTSAVNVLSSDDPVRVFQQFATLDLLSNGRAEIMAGRGSFVESFPLFGYDLREYQALFAEKLDLLLAVRESEHVRWHGHLRAPIEGRGVYPRPLQDPLPVWIAVGGTPESAARAGLLGLPMALAIIGGVPARFAPFAEIHRQATAEAGHDPARVPLGINVHGHVADTSRQAIEEACEPTLVVMNRIGAERGWPPMGRGEFEAACRPAGAYFVGDPGAVTEKILALHEVFGNDRLLIQLTVGGMPHAATLRAIELLGTEVAPTVRAEVARRTAA